jgi:hypothetical protein
MTQRVSVSKLEAAQRQLDTGIRMLFQQADPVAVHTLIGAAAMLMTDLVEHKDASRSWDRKAQEATGMDSSQYFRIMREPQNFLKHAKEDPHATYELDSGDTEALAFWAVMNASELASLSTAASVFQLWYIAARSPFTDPSRSPLKDAVAVFGDLRGETRDIRGSTSFGAWGCGLTSRSTRTRSGIAPRSVLVSVRLAAQCRCVPVNSDVRLQNECMFPPLLPQTWLPTVRSCSKPTNKRQTLSPPPQLNAKPNRSRGG